MEQPSISVIIPVKNEAGKIRLCLDAILQQTIPVCEVIVIDSGSTDGTLEILKEYEIVKLIQIDSKEFNHGTTRNLGLDAAKGDYTLFTVGDARAANCFWIEELLKGFTDDSVAGVCGLQIVPHEKDKNPLDWFRPISKPEFKNFQFASKSDFLNLSPSDKMQICSWDDVTAMYKTSLKKNIPFQKIIYGEDALWAKDALIEGYKIVYNNNAMVYHYHFEDDLVTFKKSLTTMYFKYKHFQFIYEKPKFSFRMRLSLVKILLTSLGLNFYEIIKWYKYNLKNFKAGLKAYHYFLKAIRISDDELEFLHSKYCGTPPIPLK